MVIRRDGYVIEEVKCTRESIFYKKHRPNRWLVKVTCSDDAEKTFYDIFRLVGNRLYWSQHSHVKF